MGRFNPEFCPASSETLFLLFSLLLYRLSFVFFGQISVFVMVYYSLPASMNVSRSTRWSRASKLLLLLLVCVSSISTITSIIDVTNASWSAVNAKRTSLREVFPLSLLASLVIHSCLSSGIRAIIPVTFFSDAELQTRVGGHKWCTT